ECARQLAKGTPPHPRGAGATWRRVPAPEGRGQTGTREPRTQRPEATRPFSQAGAEELGQSLFRSALTQLDGGARVQSSSRAGSPASGVRGPRQSRLRCSSPRVPVPQLVAPDVI